MRKSSSPRWRRPAGLGQLAAVCEAFFEHLERHTFPGGCFMASAALEMGTRPGPVKDLIASFQSRFGDLIRGFAATALARNELSAGEDPDRLAFELNGIMLAADTNFVLHDDPAVLDLARQIVHQRLGVSGVTDSPGAGQLTSQVSLPASRAARSPGPLRLRAASICSAISWS